jgi:hypothetical protein
MYANNMDTYLTLVFRIRLGFNADPDQVFLPVLWSLKNISFSYGSAELQIRIAPAPAPAPAPNSFIIYLENYVPFLN